MKTNHIAFYQFCSAVRRKGALALCLALCVLGLGLSASAHKPGHSIITFDVPGAGTDPFAGTYAFAINDHGVVMGWYQNAANYVHHSYLRAPDGTFTIIDDPVAATGFCEGTNAWNLNEDGTVTGNYEDASDVFHGFLRTPHGSFTTIDVPGAGSTGAECGGQGTVIGGRNEAGTIAGIYFDSSNVSHGYVRARHGSITKFDAPGAGTDPGQGTYMYLSTGVINPAGAITGYYNDSSGVYHGFIRAPHGTITTFDAPGAGTTEGGLGTYSLSINPEGAITGYYVDANWVYHGFIRAPNGNITTFDAPGAGADPGSTEGTLPLAINANGTVAGFFQGTNWLTHGFSRSPDGKFTTFDAPGEGTVVGSWQGTYPNDINLEGAITGWYIDASNVYHGFLRIP